MIILSVCSLLLALLIIAKLWTYLNKEEPVKFKPVIEMTDKEFDQYIEYRQEHGGLSFLAPFWYFRELNRRGKNG